MYGFVFVLFGVWCCVVVSCVCFVCWCLCWVVVVLSVWYSMFLCMRGGVRVLLRCCGVVCCCVVFYDLYCVGVVLVCLVW